MVRVEVDEDESGGSAGKCVGGGNVCLPPVCWSPPSQEYKQDRMGHHWRGHDINLLAKLVQLIGLPSCNQLIL